MEQHRQFAALPYVRTTEGVRVLLLTSRETGRWVIPKGWPKQGLAGNEVAAMEAKEEAGIRGRVATEPLGAYSYRKRLHAFSSVDCTVTVYALEARKQKLHWRERAQRQLAWLGQDEAAARVDEPELAALIRAFAPLP